MVVTLLVILRKVFHMEEYVTLQHLENMNKIILATGMMVGYAYATEFFVAMYSGNPYERFTFINRATGPFSWSVLDHGELQRPRAPALLVQEAPPKPPRDVRRLHPRQRGDVVRALHDHRHVAPPGLPAAQLVLLQADDLRLLRDRGIVRILLHVVPALLPFLPAISMAEVKSVLWSAKKTEAARQSTSHAKEAVHVP